MNYEHLKTFISVMEKKSFSETARRLHLSQPTVTSQIKSLEKQLGVKLFERTTKHVEVTPAAKVLYRYSKDIVKLWDLATNDLLSMSKTVQGRLVIACSLTIGDNVLPQALSQFKKEYPYIQIHVDITNTQQILSRIKDHTLDIGLIEAPVEDDSLILEPFMEDELVLIAKPNYFTEDWPPLSMEKFVKTPLILREEGSGTRSVMENHLTQAGIRLSDLHIAFELGSTEAVKAAVESGLGISIISKAAIKKELQLQTLQMYPMEDLRISRQFFIVYHRDTVLKPSAKAFKKMIETFGAQG